MRRTLALTLFLLPIASGVVAAQPATLVRDVNPTPYVAVEAPLGPQQFRSVAAGAVFFTPGDESDPASRLWATDGTAAGTRFLAAFCEAGSCFHAPLMVASLPGLAFFYAESPADPRAHPRLWRTDGTAAGTFPLTPPLSDSAYGAAASEIIAFRNRLVFTACVDGANPCSRLWATDGTVAGTAAFSGDAGSNFVLAQGLIYYLGGREYGLYRTDGTRAGTRLVKALPRLYALFNLVSAETLLFFQVGSGQVWVSDGTARGTRRVQTFGEYDHDFLPLLTHILKPFGRGKVVLTGVRGTNAVNLWVSDGTPAGTVRLTNAPNVEGRWLPVADQVETLGKRLVFSAGIGTARRLWSSQGTLATTKPLAGCPGGCPQVLPESPTVKIGNLVVFAARGGGNSGSGAELWVSDGTGPGTRLLKDLCPGACDSEPRSFRVEGGLVWFRATVDGVSQLVRTDGTPAGTVVLGPFAEGTGPVDLSVAGGGGRVFFIGFDDTYGAQPWVTNGTPAGTRRVTALPGHGGSSDPKEFTAFEGRLLFTADDGSGTTLWQADGSGAAPVVAPSDLPAPPTDLTVAGDFTYFLPGPSELWRTDGTAFGTQQVIAISSGQKISHLTALGDRLLFFNGPPTPTLWAISPGTNLVKVLELPADATRVGDATALGNEAYFTAETATRTLVYRTDGTPAGTRVLLDIPCRACSEPDFPLSFTRVGDLVYFSAWAQETRFTGPSLWRTDGTAAGTVRVLPEPNRPGGVRTFFPSDLYAFGGDLYFLANVPGNATHKIVHRGRDEASAVRLAPWGSEPFQLFTPDWTAVGNTLFFRAWDVEHGVELWKTDGTPAGTVLVRDILTKGSSYPRDLTAAGGRLYFSALDDSHGRELWVSDGTAAGTRLVQDIAPGGLSSDPEQLLLVGGRLFFTADDGVTGREPWSLIP